MLAIYVPQEHPLTPERLQELGCGKLFGHDAAPMFVGEPVEGPDSSLGRIAWIGRQVMGGMEEQPIQTYQPELQAWHEAARDGDLEPGRYWLGFWKDNPPGPVYLQRGDESEVIDGNWVQLHDGDLWLIPVAEFAPHRLTVDKQTGNECEQPAKEHREFVAAANELYAWFLGKGFQEVVSKEFRVVVPNGLSFAAMALAKNYRVNRDLVDALGLIAEHEAFAVANVACGLAAVADFAQKKTPLRELLTS